MLKFALVIGACAMPCLGGEGVHLVYKFDADTPVRYENVQKMIQEQIIQGMATTTNSHTTTISKIELLETNKDESMLIQSMSERLFVTITAPGMNISYDSTNPADQAKLSDPTVSSLASTVGMKVQLLLAQDGTVLDVPNINDVDAVTDGMQDASVQMGAASMLEKETIIATNEMNYKLLPTDAVEPGDLWHRSFEVPFAGMGIMTTNYDLTLDAVTDGVAMISITGSMSMPAIVQDGVSTTLSGAKIEGVLRFNIEDGVADLYDLITISTIEARMAGMADPLLTMTMTQSAVMTRLDD